MSRMVGTVSRGIRAPIIREGDDLRAIVVDCVLQAAESEGFAVRDRDIVCMTEAIVARAQGNYASVDDIAADVRAKLGPDKIIGVSAQTVEQAILAEKRGADYLGVGAVFPTGSKDDADDVSHETLKAICQAVNIPVIAIGGITVENTPLLKGTGICGIAVISAIYGQENIPEATRKLKDVTGRMVSEA